jgi:hypothetical protein
VKLLPASRRGRVLLAGGVAALAAALAVDWYRPWEAHYLGRPTSWWAWAFGITYLRWVP